MKPIAPPNSANGANGLVPSKTGRMDKLRALRDQSPRDWRALRWLTFGIGIKRWGLMALLGFYVGVLPVTLGFSF